jgi:hypothetical protein
VNRSPAHSFGGGVVGRPGGAVGFPVRLVDVEGPGSEGSVVVGGGCTPPGDVVATGVVVVGRVVVVVVEGDVAAVVVEVSGVAVEVRSPVEPVGGVVGGADRGSTSSTASATAARTDSTARARAGVRMRRAAACLPATDASGGRGWDDAMRHRRAPAARTSLAVRMTVMLSQPSGSH